MKTKAKILYEDNDYRVIEKDLGEQYLDKQGNYFRIIEISGIIKEKPALVYGRKKM